MMCKRTVSIFGVLSQKQKQTHQAVIKEPAATKADCCIISRCLNLCQKVALEHTTRTTSNGQLDEQALSIQHVEIKAADGSPTSANGAGHNAKTSLTDALQHPKIGDGRPLTWCFTPFSASDASQTTLASGLSD